MALYPGDRARVEQWTEARCDELDQGRFHSLLRAVDAHADHWEEVSKCFAYFGNNRDRMRYREFRAQGLCAGSGVLEAGCKRSLEVSSQDPHSEMV